MAFIIKKLNLKISLAVVLLAGLTAGFSSGLLAHATGPEFNKFPITYSQPGAPSLLDYPLIDARLVGGSYSTSQADHDDGVTAGPGQEIEFSVYYHNGVADDAANTAVNTVIKALASPSLGTADTEHRISATITANNAGTVSSDDSGRGGSMLVKISGSEARSLSLVNGSVQHLKNWGSRDAANGSSNISQTVALPNTVFTSGVNIGDVRGCWPFFGFVKFRVKVSSDTVDQGLSITKRVLNVSKDETEYKSSTNASEGDTVRFQVVVKTTGNTPQTQVVVRDTLPSRLTFFSGEDLRGSGVNLGTQQANQTHTYTFEATVTGTTAATVTNTAYVKSSVVSEKSATASVVISKTESQTRNLEITKQVRNITKNDTTFRDSTTAQENDIVRFEIRVRATGNANQTGVVVRDDLPSRLSFESGDDLRGSGENVGTLSQNETRTFTFDAKVTGSTSGTITNSARVKSDQVSEKSDSASITISTTTGGTTRGLQIQKRVRNVTDNTSFAPSVNADPGDVVEFEIRVDTTGNASQNNVTVRDVLPSRLTYKSGESLSGSRNLGTLSAGTTRTFVYEATVAQASQFSSGSSTLTNSASVKSDQVSQQNASAQVLVNRTVTTGSEQRKTAFNVTRQVNATQTPAQPGDIIVYTLYFRNTGSQLIAGKVIEDDISDILELAEIADQGGAVSVDTIIRWSPADVPAGTEISRSFQVSVRQAALFPASTDLMMINVYGNEIRVQVVRPTVSGVVTPPRTGASETTVVVLASISTFGFWVYRRKLNRFKTSPL